jgi:general L-amino acid transport system permease protein
MATATNHVRPPFWRDVRVLRIVAQLAVLGALVAFGFYLWDNLTANLRQRGLPTPTDFGYLNQGTGFRIAGLSGASSVRDAYFAVAQNTAVAALVGIVLCTLLGLLVGIGRLSSNWLVRTSSTIYVEAFRNVPPLLLIIFANSAILLQLPRLSEATELGNFLIISNRQLAIASPVESGSLGIWLLIVAVAAVAAVAVGVWRTRVHTATGEPHHRLLWAGLPFLAVAVVSFLLLNEPIGLSRPEITGRQIQGGAGLDIPFVAVILALGVYTSSHVAEIVRGSIQAVPRGQTEASSALGLSSFQRLRFVVLPQAFRIAIPPTINQYLNLTKNTSLGIAVGLAELTAFTRILIGNGRPATQSVALLMAIYLSFSLVISLLLNLYSRRVRLVER